MSPKLRRLQTLWKAIIAGVGTLIGGIGRRRSAQHHPDRTLQLPIHGDRGIIGDDNIWRQPLVWNRDPIRGEPAGERDPGGRSIFEIVNSLHEPLAKRRLADERPSLIVSNRPCDDFRCASGTAVDQHGQWDIEGRFTAAHYWFGDEIIVVLEIEVLVEGGPGVFGNETTDHLLRTGHPARRRCHVGPARSHRRPPP